MTERGITGAMRSAGGHALEKAMRRGLFGTVARRFHSDEVAILDLAEQVFKAMLAARVGEGRNTAKEG